MIYNHITPYKQKAQELAKHLRGERPNYDYLKSVFRHLRAELEVDVPKEAIKKLPYVPTEDEMKRYYEAVWKVKNFQDMMMIKTLLYTSVRVSELINIQLTDVDFHRCQIWVNQGKGKKDRIVPFPKAFKEMLAMHANSMRKRGLYTYLNRPGRKNTVTVGNYLVWQSSVSYPRTTRTESAS